MRNATHPLAVNCLRLTDHRLLRDRTALPRTHLSTQLVSALHKDQVSAVHLNYLFKGEFIMARTTTSISARRSSTSRSPKLATRAKSAVRKATNSARKMVKSASTPVRSSRTSTSGRGFSASVGTPRSHSSVSMSSRRAKPAAKSSIGSRTRARVSRAASRLRRAA